MKKREIFVFAGQSNMVGAAALAPKQPLSVSRCLEYKHKPRRLGAKRGAFVPVTYKVGEFSYIDTSSAYKNTDPSDVANYRETTYFTEAMSNVTDDGIEHPYVEFSEKNALRSASLAACFAEEWEALGEECLIAHIAKGSTSIRHYFDEAMIDAVNAEIKRLGLNLPEEKQVGAMQSGASHYFAEKVRDFFADADAEFEDEDHTSRSLFWLQGEDDAEMPCELYKIYLSVLWARARELGFVRFFVVRVGYWGKPQIAGVMRAQEDFCAETEGAYIVSRAMSMMPFPNQDEAAWFLRIPTDEYRNCRDSFFGYNNNHINEKGHRIIARRVAKNVDRVINKGQSPVLEEENVKALIK